MRLDRSQREFCESDARHLRLLAPAGCGKTHALLCRCLHLSKRRGDEKFLLVTFTKAAELEILSRLATDPDFKHLYRLVTVSTLNAYGYRRLRNELQNPRLLSSRKERYFAMKNQLQPVWHDDERLSSAVTGRGNYGHRLMEVIDNLKTLGFDHTADTSLDKFSVKLDSLHEQGLWPRMEEQADALIRFGIFDEDVDLGAGRKGRKVLYDRFFTFWREAVGRLHEESTFTLVDQKYWCWLNLRSPGPDGKAKKPVTGAARFAHVLVDEFQDINPLDLALIKTISDRHRASVTIVGDDDQAIFEWNGATPDYILYPERYFGAKFQTVILRTNYRSPQNIVAHSQKLIQYNKRRAEKAISAAPGMGNAEIKIREVGPIDERLRLVTKIARGIREPGRVAVIGRVRSQLIPYEVFYASDGGPVKTATDLDVFAGEAFDHLVELLEIWERRDTHRGAARVLKRAIEVLGRVKKYPFNRNDRKNIQQHLQTLGAKTVADAVHGIASYSGPKLSGRQPEYLADKAGQFIDAGDVAGAVKALADGFDGLRFDFEKAEDDIWFTAPPLKQLADMAESERMSAEDLIERLEAAKSQLRHYQSFGDEGDEIGEDRPLHLMTATRAKGKEFDTVILLDVNEGIWPHKRAKTEHEMEAERRLFYVAFTRAQKRVIFLSTKDAPMSRFVGELGLPVSRD